MKQQILSKTELSAKFGNRTVSIVEVHSSSPTIAHEEDSPPAGVIEAALPFLIEDGSLRPQWGLFCKEDSGDGIGNLWLEGKRNPGTTLIHYDNSQTACANLDHGIYESDGRGSLKLMDVMTTRPSTMPSGVIGSQR